MSKDQVPGGLADDMRPSDFDPEQLRRGVEHELEHTDDPALAREIAMDHLAEDPVYYDKLDQLESKGIVSDAGAWLARKWESLEGRYGRKAALAMAVAGLATFPIPGNITAVIGAAEAIRGIHGWMTRELTAEEVEKMASKAYAGLEGPYRSQWSSQPVFLIRTAQDLIQSGGNPNQEAWAVVQNNQQPRDGHHFPTERDARAWLRDNGYSKSLSKSIVAVDMHRTLMDGPGPDFDGPPAEGAKEAMEKLQAAGHQVTVWTVGKTDGARAWMEQHGIPFDYVNETPITPEDADNDNQKIRADAYVDDKAIWFDGDWAATADAVLERLAEREEKYKAVPKEAVEQEYKDDDGYWLKVKEGWEIKENPDQRWIHAANKREAHSYTVVRKDEGDSIDKGPGGRSSEFLRWAGLTAAAVGLATGNPIPALMAAGGVAYDWLVRRFNDGYTPEQLAEALGKSKHKEITIMSTVRKRLSVNPVRKRLGKMIGEYDAENHEADFVVSTEAPDRDGDTVDQETLDWSEFDAAPTMTLAHDTDRIPVGKWLPETRKITYVKDPGTGEEVKATVMRGKFNLNTEEGREVAGSVKEGFLQAASVSFLPQDGGVDKNDAGGSHYTRAKVTETAVCAVPANQGATRAVEMVLKSYRARNKTASALKPALAKLQEAQQIANRAGFDYTARDIGRAIAAVEDTRELRPGGGPYTLSKGFTGATQVVVRKKPGGAGYEVYVASDSGEKLSTGYSYGSEQEARNAARSGWLNPDKLPVVDKMQGQSIIWRKAQGHFSVDQSEYRAFLDEARSLGLGVTGRGTAYDSDPVAGDGPQWPKSLFANGSEQKIVELAKKYKLRLLSKAHQGNQRMKIKYWVKGTAPKRAVLLRKDLAAVAKADTEDEQLALAKDALGADEVELADEAPDLEEWVEQELEEPEHKVPSDQGELGAVDYVEPKADEVAEQAAELVEAGVPEDEAVAMAWKCLKRLRRKGFAKGDVVVVQTGGLMHNLTTNETEPTPGAHAMVISSSGGKTTVKFDDNTVHEVPDQHVRAYKAKRFKVRVGKRWVRKAFNAGDKVVVVGGPYGGQKLEVTVTNPNASNGRVAVDSGQPGGQFLVRPDEIKPKSGPAKTELVDEPDATAMSKGEADAVAEETGGEVVEQRKGLKEDAAAALDATHGIGDRDAVMRMVRRRLSHWLDTGEETGVYQRQSNIQLDVDFLRRAAQGKSKADGDDPAPESLAAKAEELIEAGVDEEEAPALAYKVLKRLERRSKAMDDLDDGPKGLASLKKWAKTIEEDLGGMHKAEQGDAMELGAKMVKMIKQLLAKKYGESDEPPPEVKDSEEEEVIETSKRRAKSLSKAEKELCKGELESLEEMSKASGVPAVLRSGLAHETAKFRAKAGLDEVDEDVDKAFSRGQRVIASPPGAGMDFEAVVVNVYQGGGRTLYEVRDQNGDTLEDLEEDDLKPKSLRSKSLSKDQKAAAEEMADYLESAAESTDVPKYLKSSLLRSAEQFRSLSAPKSKVTDGEEEEEKVTSEEPTQLEQQSKQMCPECANEPCICDKSDEQLLGEMAASLKKLNRDLVNKARSVMGQQFAAN